MYVAILSETLLLIISVILFSVYRTFYLFFRSSLDNLNLNKNTALILLYLTKAFDTVNHENLLSKLYRYGIRGNANKLFASFNKQTVMYF